MKKFLIFILALIFIIAFCGCGCETEGDYSSSSHNEEKTIVYMYDFNGNVIQQWDNVDYAVSTNEGVYFYLNDGYNRIEICGAPVLIVKE